MPFPALVAIGASISTAAAAVTLQGLAIGATIVGTGLNIIGAATGSKTLKKIGSGFSMAGGIVGIGSMASSGFAAMSSASGGSSGLMQNNSMDKMLSAPTKGTQGFKTFGGGYTGGQSSSIDAFNKATGSISSSPAGGFDPELERTFFQRANTTLTQHSPIMNMLGGAGDAYITNQKMDLEKRQLDKRLAFEQQLVDRVNVNNGTPLNINPAMNLGRNTGAYTGLLRGQ